jgi:hypothetical protein
VKQSYLRIPSNITIALRGVFAAAQARREEKAVPLPSIEDVCGKLSLIEDAIAEQSAKVEAHKRVLAYAEKTQRFFILRRKELHKVIKEIKDNERRIKRGRSKKNR